MKRFLIITVSLFALMLLYACSDSQEKMHDPEPVIEQVTNHEITVGSVTGQYTGTLTDGIPTGNGSIAVNVSGLRWVFDGEFINGALADGKLTDFPLTVKLQNEDVNGTFTGAAVSGQPSGSGVFSASDTEMKYEGELTNGGLSGEGKVSDFMYTLEYDSNEYLGVYNGDIIDGMISGEGSFDYEQDDVYFNYVGGWLDGAFAEDGFLKSNDFTVHFSEVSRTGTFEGEMFDGMAHGHGVFSAVNDDDVSYVYTGDWEKNLYNGQGILIFDDDMYFDRIGTFEDGDFTPTVSEAFVSFGTVDAMGYSVNDYSIEFMNEHNSLFTSESKEDTKELISILNELTNSAFAYGEFSKNPSRYDGGIFKATRLTVNQIVEQEMWGSIERTFLIAQDRNWNVYFINYLGYADGIYAGNRITLYALPLDYMTFENSLGGVTWAIACAAIYIHK